MTDEVAALSGPKLHGFGAVDFGASLPAADRFPRLGRKESRRTERKRHGRAHRDVGPVRVIDLSGCFAHALNWPNSQILQEF